MNMQEILDFTFEKLWNQNKRALFDNKAACTYRGPDGTKCAVGWLIPDEKYQKVFEFQTLSTIWDVLKFPVELIFFIRKLQVAHDTCFDEQGLFRHSLKQNYIQLAEKFNLDTSFIESFKE